ncbi:N-acetylglucosaminyl-diphospho-decaprenol L-rhamnosyltransferase [Jannaschia seosinensis]|uniref:N-acetylglucosaminyl-diphospho-decaprenol L-rhamnosyltransferase n=1 Tax=Jannaschia seosinensis TaxID=313367 RepID=A0A0M7B915_9RHOB|nr:glycosyltransferase family 2 protein [Jannaschia seosinensis]CUH20668.1 N-acetylglucosaminyl-diphospho-decaprenol L-rhamnosyltransferase [Jannaschia seosinensis]
MSTPPRHENLRLVVSIINYQTADLTKACVTSVLDDMAQAGLTDGAARVVVVDNASGDGSDEIISRWLAERPGMPVDLVRSDTNTGFSGGHNQGTGLHGADYYLVLNSDAFLRPGFLGEILSAADAHPEAGLIVPRIEHEDGVVQVNCFRFASPASEFIRGMNTGIVTRLLNRRNVSLGTEPEADQIEWASFACILLRGTMVESVGPMDEGYFLYFEDAEYCLRARRAGWDIHRAPEAVAVHHRGGSGPVKALAQARKRLPPYYYASRSRFLAQAHGRGGLWGANLLWLTGRGFGQLRRLAGKEIYPMAEKELRDIWIGTADPTASRRTFQDTP